MTTIILLLALAAIGRATHFLEEIQFSADRDWATHDLSKRNLSETVEEDRDSADDSIPTPAGSEVDLRNSSSSTATIKLPRSSQLQVQVLPSGEVMITLEHERFAMSSNLTDRQLNMVLQAAGQTQITYSGNSSILEYSAKPTTSEDEFTPALNLSMSIPNCVEESSQSGSEQQHSSAAIYNYEQHGEDWPEQFPECAIGVQSPMNLLPPRTKYGQSYEIFDFNEDKLKSEYWDLEDTMVEFHPKVYSIEVLIDHTHGYAGFESKVGETAMGAPTKWDALEFIFHHKSEHLIDGEQFDLELQIIHKVHVEALTFSNEALGFSGRRLQGGLSVEGDERRSLASAGVTPTQTASGDDFRYAVVSILFSVDNYSENVDHHIEEEFDKFFSELNFEEDDHLAEHIIFGELMEHIDWSHRWVYKGSLTVPPCSHSVYWNVIGSVYPIRKNVVEAFARKLKRASGGSSEGNYRKPSTTLNLDVYYIKSGAAKAKTMAVLMGSMLALMIII